ncbi:hypothetical protein [Bradyrhizobium liaoningense]
MGARKDVADPSEEVWRVTKRPNALLGAEFDLAGYHKEIFTDKRLQICDSQESREIGAVPIILTPSGCPDTTQPHHETTVSNHTLPVIEDGDFDLDVPKSKEALMRRLRQVSRPTGLGGLPSNFPSLVA